MDTVLWIVQILLACIFLGAGASKLAQPRERLAAGPMPWAADYTDEQVRGIGAVELLAAAGLIVPAVLDVAPAITALAATGIVLLMLGAVRVHLRRSEKEMVPLNLGIVAMALLVAFEFLA